MNTLHYKKAIRVISKKTWNDPTSLLVRYINILKICELNKSLNCYSRLLLHFVITLHWISQSVAIILGHQQIFILHNHDLMQHSLGIYKSKIADERKQAQSEISCRKRQKSALLNALLCCCLLWSFPLQLFIIVM